MDRADVCTCSQKRYVCEKEGETSHFSNDASTFSPFFFFFRMCVREMTRCMFRLLDVKNCTASHPKQLNKLLFWLLKYDDSSSPVCVCFRLQWRLIWNLSISRFFWKVFPLSLFCCDRCGNRRVLKALIQEKYFPPPPSTLRSSVARKTLFRLVLRFPHKRRKRVKSEWVSLSLCRAQVSVHLWHGLGVCEQTGGGFFASAWVTDVQIKI